MVLPTGGTKGSGSGGEPGTPPSGGAGKTKGNTGKSSPGKPGKKGSPSTANQSGNQPILQQPNFSAETLSIPFPMQGGASSPFSYKVKKGYLQWDKTTVPSAYQTSGSTSGKSGNTKGKGGSTGSKNGKTATTKSSTANQAVATVDFQYNPSTTSYSSSNVGAQAAAAAVFQDSSDSSILTTPMQQTISFDLLFNRIYEVQGSYNTDGTPKGGSGIMDATVHGCYVDILAMAQFCGQLAGDNGAGKNNTKQAPPKQNNINTSIVFQGPSFLIRSWLVLGADDTCLYYGYVSDWSYQIAAWTQFMVPVTCVISVDFTLLPFNPSSTDLGPGNGNSPWSLIPPGQPAGSPAKGKKGDPFQGPGGGAAPNPIPGGNSPITGKPIPAPVKPKPPTVPPTGSPGAPGHL